MSSWWFEQQSSLAMPHLSVQRYPTPYTELRHTHRWAMTIHSTELCPLPPTHHQSMSHPTFSYATPFHWALPYQSPSYVTPYTEPYRTLHWAMPPPTLSYATPITELFQTLPLSYATPTAALCQKNYHSKCKLFVVAAEMDFLMEALIMSKFNHTNIVHFIGVCFDKHPR